MGSPSQNNGVTLGALKPQTTFGDYNNILFAITQAISKLQTATLVQVKSCTNAGELDPVGFVDVVPLVNQIDGSGNPTPHVTIYNVPYLRIQGGSNAVIIDPEPGDIGIAVFASRDISKVKTTKSQANPGSFRQYDFSDALYLGGVLNGSPTQYVRFSSDGIEIDTPNTITLRGSEIVIDGPVSQSGGNVTIDASLSVTGDVTAGGSPISLVHHKHTSASPGSPTSEPLP